MSTLLTASGKGAPLTPTEADGNLTLIQTRTGDGWIDLLSELLIRDTPNSPIGEIYKGGIYLWRFPVDEMREGFANFHMPHSWKQGTMLYPHMHFTVKTNDAGVVRWGFEYTWARRHDSTGQTVFPATDTLYRDFVVPPNSADTHFVAEMPEGQGIVGTGLEVDAMILMRIFRDGTHENDTFPDSAYGFTVDLHMEVDRYATLNRAPNFYE